ncbi:tetratricopeptide repeat protein [Burkholderia sp. Se-20378]|uniref:O-linked N-acetylglucosamine transferase family protein n=1 Tax=Burkholderia sp. Se-20378 TaxID=2703899 RepID=UPI0019809BA2|nr:tetratricopeptide repeat protein [Burkholderia sp. Se-20378]MBN3769066.1 tetratricopeptide repeat protein [Burkholderia sp. Se-20378]
MSEYNVTGSDAPRVGAANAEFSAGVAAHHAGQAADAARHYRTALSLYPDHTEALNNLGILLEAEGNAGEAEHCYRRALEIHAGNVDACFNLGLLLHDGQRFAEAEACYRRVLASSPDHGPVLRRLGLLLQLMGRYAEAERTLRDAVIARPGDAVIHADLATLLQALGQLDEAERHYRESLSYEPNGVATHNLLGTLLHKRGRLPEAETCFRRAVSLQPDAREARGNLGNVLFEQQRYGEAEACYREVLAHDPSFAEVWSNLGRLLHDAGRLDEAATALRHALTLDHDCAPTLFNLSLVLLAMGQYEEGWRNYEARFQPSSHWGDTSAYRVLASLPAPLWQGEPLDGKSLVVWPEQGFGDVVQFARYLPLLKQRGLSTLTVVCPAALTSLIATVDGVDHCVGLDEAAALPAHDYAIPIMSLPLHCGTTLDSIPATVPYLHVPAPLVERWRSSVPAAGLKVGLVWAGDPRPDQAQAHATDRRRSLPARAYLPLLQIPGVSFVSLQKGETTRRQIDTIPSSLRPVDPMEHVRDFADTAAIIAHLDLVITVDTSVAHVAGALGKPVWILSRFDGCWRWLADRDDSPWYPRARLFRQSEPGRWSDVVERVAGALEHLCAERDALRVTAVSQEDLDRRFSAGLQLFPQRRLAEAVAFYDAALSTETDPFVRAYLLGYRAQSLNGLGRVDEALEQTDLALQLDPAQLSALCTRAYALLLKQQFQLCLECCDRGLAFHPDRIELLHNRTAALAGLVRNDAALETSERILALNPHDARALNNSAVMLDRLARYDEAAQRYKRAVAVNPDEPWVLGALLTAQLRTFDWDGLDGLRERIASRVADGRPTIEPFRYLAVCADPQQQLDAARIYVAHRIPRPATPSAFRSAGMPRGKIRIGYFSSDFRTHPMMELMADVFELHDREQFEIHAFSFFDDPNDPAQRRARAAFDRFHDVDGMTSDEIVATALNETLDIAIDLNGHTMGARPMVFATRIAPVQIAYLGYPASTGADYIDYIFADEVVIPRTHQPFYSEKVIYLPGSFQPNDRHREPPGRQLDRSAYGLPEHGFVYSCFNDPVKLLPLMFERWANILKAVEGSVLWLHSRNSEIARGNLRREAAARGLDPGRIVFAPRVPLADHFARQACADLFLDTVPFNAGATASCALWCGLPVLTVPGDTFASRYGASLLAAVGLPELIAPDIDAYEAIAVDLARSPGRLGAIRQKLREARDQSPLFDTRRFVRHLEQAYRLVLQRYASGLPPDTFDLAVAD